MLPRSRKSRAQAMVEFALVLPILLLLVYGLIEVGRLLFIYSSGVSAARQAARYGSTTGVNTAGGTPRYQDCAGMRDAAQGVAFIVPIEDTNIDIRHDEGEGVNEVSYCAPGAAIDTSFIPSTGNISRVRVRVVTEYSPILPILPLEPFQIESISARTILVNVPIEITAPPQGWDPNATPIPTSTVTATITNTPTITYTPSATGTFTSTPTATFTPSITLTPTTTYTPSLTLAPTHTLTPTNTQPATATLQYTPTAIACSISHSTLKIIVTEPKKVSMTLQNDPISILTAHVASITVYFNQSGGQNIQFFYIVPDTVWSGNDTSPWSITIANPSLATYTFAPNVSKIFTAEFKKDYAFSNPATQIDRFVITFVEPECPTVTVTQ